MEMPKKPSPAPEMARLERFVGARKSTGEVEAPAGAQATKAGGDKAKPMTFKGEAKYEWALGGMRLMCDGWHEMGEGLK